MSTKCDKQHCESKAQAACFHCQMLLCFKCSMSHAQETSTKGHRIVQLGDCSPVVSELCQSYLGEASRILKDYEELNASKDSNPSEILHPERFQQQLDEINYMKKETLKVIEKFFSEISLELVNIWEYYLKKFSSFEDTRERIVEVKSTIDKYLHLPHLQETNLRNFFKEAFPQEIKICQQKIQTINNDIQVIPSCPQVKIDDRVLIQLSEILCNSISTVDFSRGEASTSQKLNISAASYLLSTVKEIPVFPIKKPFCFLFKFAKKEYQIQEFNQLDYLPDYPKTIVIPNGDIHLIGGVMKKDQILDTHLVFRSSSAEVFKLNNLPFAVNPSNSLVYHNKYIFLVGGIVENQSWSQQCLKYSLEFKEWKMVKPMKQSKPHQSCFTFNDWIYCFGIPENKKINIQKYSINENIWEEITISNFLSNPFNFASGFVTIQINPEEVLFFGGKKFLENAMTKKRSTDKTLSPQMHIFKPHSNSFVQLGPLNPCVGVQYGEFNPIVQNGTIYISEHLVCKNNPLVRWYDALQVLQVTPQAQVQGLIILNES